MATKTLRKRPMRDAVNKGFDAVGEVAEGVVVGARVAKNLLAVAEIHTQILLEEAKQELAEVKAEQLGQG